MKKLRIHPLFLVITVIFVVMKKTLVFVNSLIAIIIHEGAHLLAARSRGYEMGGITLMPYGGTVESLSKIQKNDELFISLIGPITNVIVAFVLIALWWIMPESYYFTNNLVLTNMTIGLFNLLPSYPLDMSRVLIAYSKNKQRTLKALRLVGIFLGAFSLGFFIISIFYKPNVTLLIIGVTLLVSATFGIKKEYMMEKINRLGIVKNIDVPLEKKTVIVDYNMPILRLTRLLTPTSIHLFEIVRDGRVIKVLKEDELVEIASMAHRCDIIGKWT